MMTSESPKQLKTCLFLDLILEDHGFGLGDFPDLSLPLTGACGVVDFGGGCDE